VAEKSTNKKNVRYRIGVGRGYITFCTGFPVPYGFETPDPYLLCCQIGQMGGAQRPADRMDFDNKLAECSDRNLCGRCTPAFTAQLLGIGGVGGGGGTSFCDGILGQVMEGKIDSWGP
jgi:hypothetical protein